MEVLTLTNDKGGVGKTSLVITIACGLAFRGWRVLMIDGDPQGHTSIRFGYDKIPGLYDLLVRDIQWDAKGLVKLIPPEKYGIPGEVLPSAGRLRLLPGNKETRVINQMLERPETLAMRLEELEDQVDVVVIDTSPTPSLLHGVFYTASDSIVYPTELAMCSFDGLIESLRAREAASELRKKRWGLPPIAVTGIVPTKFRKNVNEQEENLAKLKAKFGNAVWPTLGLRTIWPTAEAKMVPVWNLDPNSEAASEAWELVDRVEASVKKKQVKEQIHEQA